MSNNYAIKEQSEVYYVTFTVVDWLDVFIKKRYFDIIVESLKYCRENKGLNVHAYVIMTNHFHAILSSKQNTLAVTVRDFKSFTAKAMIRALQNDNSTREAWILKRLMANAGKNQRDYKHQFWMSRNHAKIYLYPKFTLQKLNYIHDNPVRAGYVLKQEHWIYSSASNYLNNEGIMEIDLLDF